MANILNLQMNYKEKYSLHDVSVHKLSLLNFNRFTEFWLNYCRLMIVTDTSEK